MEITVIDNPRQGTEKLSTHQPVPVLCVDLDRTLLATDTFLEAILILLKQSPWLLFLFPFWGWKGKAYLKRQVANRVPLNVASLPYREDVLTYLKEEFHLGRKLVLATGTDEYWAKKINDHLGIFSEILASNGHTNLVGSEKGRLLEDRFGFRGFDYIGNDVVDLRVWSAANAALVAEPSKKLLGKIAQCTHIQHTFAQPPSVWAALIKEIRIYQWVKNILIFLPIATAHRLFNPTELVQECIAFMAFSLCASSLYVFNDLLDLPADRRHPKKRFRPFASGALSIQTGVLLQPLLLLAAFLISILVLPSAFSYLLLTYAMTTMAYSIYLKKTAILDVLTLASLYTLRIIAGGVAVGITISSWLLAFSLFFFLSLAIGKRYAELQFRKVSTFQGIERRAYVGADKDILATMGVISGYMSVLVLALYINSQEVTTLYTNPQLLWLICPLLLYWISRTWLLAHRGTPDDDPLIAALKDPRSYVVAISAALIALVAI